MQLELAFLEQPVVPDEGSKGPWDQIDPQAQIAALVCRATIKVRQPVNLDERVSAACDEGKA